jgi:hypothetical protein
VIAFTAATGGPVKEPVRAGIDIEDRDICGEIKGLTTSRQLLRV